MEEEIKNQLFAITATDKVDLATLEFDQRCIEARKTPPNAILALRFEARIWRASILA